MFMKDLVKRPAIVDYLLDQLTTMAAESARILARSGMDVLVLDDDVAYNGGLLISPAMWRRYFKPAAGPHHRGRPHDGPRRGAVSQRRRFHRSAGRPIEIGVDAVNPVAPDCMDAAAIRRRFGARLALWGTVGTAWAWDHGSPAQMREEVRARLEAAGRRGLLLCPAYDLDFTPRENVAAFLEAVREFG